MSSCAYHPVQCPHHSFGCAWKGAANELNAHITHRCVFEQLKEYLHKTEQQISHFKHTIEQQSQEINKLKRSLQEVSVHYHIWYWNIFKRISDACHQRHGEDDEERPLKAVSSQERSNTSHVAEHETSTRWKVHEMKCVRTLWGHVRGVTALNVWHSTYLLSGSHDTKIRLWDLSRDCKCVAQLEGHRVTVWSIETDPHSPTVFSGAGDGAVKVWRIDDTPRCEATMQHGDGKVYCLLWTGGQSDQGRQSLLYSGAYRTLKLWDVSSHTAVVSLDAHQDCIWGIKSTGPDTFVTASEDRTVAVWDKRHHSLVKRIHNKEAHERESARALSVAVGGGYIYVGSDDCKIRVFDQHNFEHVTTLTGHHWEVWQLGFSEGYLFSGSFDHTVRVWEQKTWTCVKTLAGHNGYIHALTIDKGTLFTGSGDKSIKLWRSDDLYSNFWALISLYIYICSFYSLVNNSPLNARRYQFVLTF